MFPDLIIEHFIALNIMFFSEDNEKLSRILLFYEIFLLKKLPNIRC